MSAAEEANPSLPVAIVGGGPIGLTAALDLAIRGVPTILIDEGDPVAEGSRAICWAQKSLEILDRVGVGERAAKEGVSWSVGRVYYGGEELFSFDLLPETDCKMPAFVNLSQSRVERMLVDRCADFPRLIDLRWRHSAIGVRQLKDRVRLEVRSAEGISLIEASHVLACDGAKSTMRRLLGLELKGDAFEEQFLIADVILKKGRRPNERRFWFAPPFHDGQTALLHRQPDDVYRLDLQLGEDADPEKETRTSAVIARAQRALGERPIDVAWASAYRFRCARLERFVHGRIVFVGDSAHVVSPFGARGGNGGLHDVDNLIWKLAAIRRGDADHALLASYDEERGRAADENLLCAARTAAFMAPATPVARQFRDETLRLARRHQFARALVNSGRLSTPCSLKGGTLQTSDENGKPRVAPGECMPDVPLAEGEWLLKAINGQFALVTVGKDNGKRTRSTTPTLNVPDHDAARRRIGSGTYLARPDGYAAAHWKHPPTQKQIRDALNRAMAKSKQPS